MSKLARKFETVKGGSSTPPQKRVDDPIDDRLMNGGKWLSAKDTCELSNVAYRFAARAKKDQQGCGTELVGDGSLVAIQPMANEPSNEPQMNPEKWLHLQHYADIAAMTRMQHMQASAKAQGKPCIIWMPPVRKHSAPKTIGA